MDSTREPGSTIQVLPDLAEPWPAVVCAFLAETYLRGRSERTTAEYARILRRFLAVQDPATANPMAIRAFAYAPVGPEIPPAPATVGVRLAVLSGLYAMAAEAGLAQRNPAAGIRRPRPSIAQPHGLDAGEVQRLLAAIPTDPIGLRDRAIVVLVLFTGLRRAEALGLRIRDVDLDAATFAVRVKGGRSRRRALPPPAADAIERWLEASGANEEDLAEQLLFGVGPAAFYARLRDHAARAGLSSCTPHALRHTAAQLRRRGGASIEEVSELLGHASIATTARYLRRLEPETDDGWRPVARALGIGGPDRPIRPSTGSPRSRASPIDQNATGQVLEHPPGLSDRRALGAPLPMEDSTSS